MEGTSLSLAACSTLAYGVLDHARKITKDAGLNTLEIRKHVGIPLAIDIKHWISECPDRALLQLDFTGIRAVNLSVAEELGPALMQIVSADSSLVHKYPVFTIESPEPLYTFARAFANSNWNGLALLNARVEPTQLFFPISECDAKTFVVLGPLSEQMKSILAFAETRAKADTPITSDTLKELSFLSSTKLAARSKRLTELHTRRLLAFKENPDNPKERLFIPTWSLSE